jgi:hypothetical protein
VANRRQASQLIGSALLAFPKAGAAAASPSPRWDAVRNVLVDQRFPASLAFAQPFLRRGAAARAFAGDLTHLWLHDLGPLWKARPEPLAGLTGPDALFVLAELARGAGLRVLARTFPQPSSPAVAWLIARNSA